MLNEKRKYCRAITYEQFMKFPAEIRKEHSNFFLSQSLTNDKCPVLVKMTHGGKPLPLKMCKFLISTNTTMREQQERLRELIIKHVQEQLTAKDSLFFWYNNNLLKGDMLVKDFLKSEFKDNEKDGWLHLFVTTQQTSGTTYN